MLSNLINPKNISLILNISAFLLLQLGLSILELRKKGRSMGNPCGVVGEGTQCGLVIWVPAQVNFVEYKLLLWFIY